MKDELKQIAIELFEIGAVKYGDFVVKSGLPTPIYIDFRIIVSYPKLLLRISRSLLNLVNLSDFTHICGVPYTALPIATAISTENDIPMLIRRKEAKSYGTKKIIEGIFKPGDKSLIIEDIITSGLSILETTNDLKKVGLVVTNAVIIVDREQGGKENLNRNGIEVKSLFKLSELMNLLLEAGKLDQKSVNIVLDYIKSVSAPLKIDDRLTLDFSNRAKLAKNPMSARLLNLMSEKQSNLCLAADFIKSEEILELAEIAGEHIAVLKIHVDILEDFNQNFITNLKSLSKKYNFMIMEDRKFADIGQIVSYQYRKGLYSIAEWADFITVHMIPGSGILKGIEEGLDGILENRGIFIVAQMSSEGALTSEDYVQASVSAAKDSGIVSGFVCQKNISSDPGHIQVTPGVKLNKSKDSLGQQYNTPQVVVDSGADLVVVGRGITHAKEKLAAVLEYKKVLWEAYENRKSKLVV